MVVLFVSFDSLSPFIFSPCGDLITFRELLNLFPQFFAHLIPFSLQPQKAEP